MTAEGSGGDVSNHAEQVLDEVRKRIAPEDKVLKAARERRDAVKAIAMRFGGTARSFNSGSVAHATANNPGQRRRLRRRPRPPQPSGFGSRRHRRWAGGGRARDSQGDHTRDQAEVPEGIGRDDQARGASRSPRTDRRQGSERRSDHRLDAQEGRRAVDPPPRRQPLGPVSPRAAHRSADRGPGGSARTPCARPAPGKGCGLQRRGRTRDVSIQRRGARAHLPSEGPPRAGREPRAPVR